MDFDASWCTVCDKLIAPKRYNIPLDPPAPVPPTKKSQGGRTKPQPIPLPNPTRYRTVIDQGPQGLYCSEDCRMADLTASYDRPVFPDRTPSCSSSSKPRKYSTHALALAQQLNFPPLPDLNTIVYADDDDDDAEFYCQPDEYTGGIIMAGRRIAEALPKPMKPRTSRYDPKPEVPKPIPGWTDGSNAWRASVYYNTRLHSDPTINTSPKPKVRTTRRANANACREERPHDPTADLYERFNECMSLRAESRMSASSTSPDSPAPLRRERSFLPSGAVGKLLVPNVMLKARSPSSASLSSSSPSSSATSSSSRRSVRSPLSSSSTSSDQDLLTPLRSKRPQPEPMRSWSADNMLQYAPMKQPTRIVKRTERVVGEDGEEKIVDVEREELPQKLFLFPMARPMAPPPPGALLPASVRASSS